MSFLVCKECGCILAGLCFPVMILKMIKKKKGLLLPVIPECHPKMYTQNHWLQRLWAIFPHPNSQQADLKSSRCGNNLCLHQQKNGNRKTYYGILSSLSARGNSNTSTTSMPSELSQSQQMDAV